MDVMMRRRELMGMQGRLKTVSGPIVTVNDALARNAKSLIVNFAPIQAAGTPSPSNVRPISGWTGVTGYHSGADTSNPTTYPVTFPAVGKNLFNKNAITANTWIIANGTGTESASGYSTSDYIPVVQGTVYYAPAKGSGRCAYYDSEKNGIAYYSWTGGSAFTAQHTGYMRITLLDSSVNYDIYQFEKGSSASSYEPYTNTIYGGYVDLASGVLVAEYGMVDLGTLTYSQNGTDSVYASVSDRKASSTILYCDSLIVRPATDSVSTMPDNSVRPSGQYNSVIIKKTGISYTNARTMLAGMHVVYELATPITYQLTPQTIAMLKGTNNVWSNANGNIELTYYAQ